jgi:hypothetical protein
MEGGGKIIKKCAHRSLQGKVTCGTMKHNSKTHTMFNMDDGNWENILLWKVKI